MNAYAIHATKKEAPAAVATIPVFRIFLVCVITLALNTQRTLFNKFKISRGALIILIYLYCRCWRNSILYARLCYVYLVAAPCFLLFGATWFLHHHHQRHSRRRRQCCHRYHCCLHYFHSRLFCAIEHIGWLVRKCEHFKDSSSTLSLGCSFDHVLFLSCSLTIVYPIHWSRCV